MLRLLHFRNDDFGKLEFKRWAKLAAEFESFVLQ